MSSHTYEGAQKPNRILQEISGNIRPLSESVASKSQSRKRSFDVMHSYPTLTTSLHTYHALLDTVPTLGTPRKQYRELASTTHVGSSEGWLVKRKLTVPSLYHPTLHWHWMRMRQSWLAIFHRITARTLRIKCLT